MTQAIFYDTDIENSHIADILKEIYMDHIYVPLLLGKKDLTILDIGSNVGITVQYFSKYAKQLYALEPSLEHYATLKQMVEFNKLTNVKMYPFALANTVGTMPFYHNTNVTMDSLDIQVNDNNKPVDQVPTVTIQSLMLTEKIDHVDLLKLDVEGAEFDIIGGKPFTEVADKIDTVVVELHAWANRNYDQMRTTLMDYGYKVKQMPTAAVVYVATR